MINELWEYECPPGAAERLHRRFAEHVFDLFERHGVMVVGFWHERDEPGRIVYLTRFADEPDRDRAWHAFHADEEWLRVKERSEFAGPLVARRRSRVLVTPRSWLEREASKAEEGL